MNYPVQWPVQRGIRLRGSFQTLSKFTLHLDGGELCLPRVGSRLGDTLCVTQGLLQLLSLQQTWVQVWTLLWSSSVTWSKPPYNTKPVTPDWEEKTEGESATGMSSTPAGPWLGHLLSVLT